MEASGQLLYPQGKNLQYPAGRRVGWPPKLAWML